MASIDLDGLDNNGEYANGNRYVVLTMGKPVRLMAQNHHFDPTKPLPSKALATSTRHIYAVHSGGGFFVARIEDVVSSSMSFNGRSVQDLSLVNVPMENVSILAISDNFSMLAAAAGGVMSFFHTRSLHQKIVEPFIRVTLAGDSSTIKDVAWRSMFGVRDFSEDFSAVLVLMSDGKLYHATPPRFAPFEKVMDDVDAVDWNEDGSSMAVVQNNTLRLMSSRFEEQLRMSLSFKSWIGEPGVNCSIKVDSISWALPDTIIVGCFRLIAGGEEEGYMIQIIQSQEGKFVGAETPPTVRCYYDVFPCLVDDRFPFRSGPYMVDNIVPFKSGPYLLTCCLDTRLSRHRKYWNLVFAATRKNYDEHIALIGRKSENDSPNSTEEVAVFEIERETHLPRIALQDNTDENLILGLCCDKCFDYRETFERYYDGVVRFLYCLTLEGKITVMAVLEPDKDELNDGVDYGLFLWLGLESG